MAVDAKKVQLPDVGHPFGYVDGKPIFVDPAWYDALQAVVELSNKTKDEVDTQHP